MVLLPLQVAYNVYLIVGNLTAIRDKVYEMHANPGAF
jgi:hypothetical protein